MKETILNHIEDMISDFLCYDRKEDEDLPLGAIEKAINDGDVTVEEIVASFRKHLIDGLAE
ncbi:MAG: hypothetical protein OQK82_05660 [Candidatus Pacearchaeota archaeon]|nr:hypothetical protein [Candidatus Pacearchaeota archaeon]